ncbi:MAG: DUF302 domain-containing protein [Dehalococcoidia bacterium]|nr:DUF302 domain-containing protein [Dehalococcoidia bacterium]MCB9486337.1 DUF302 domain-containing protein [Thermoflexaceae bacterium]
MRRELAISYDQAVAKTKDALKAQGFGVLTEIDMKATLKAKLDADLDPYIILGACNPPLAHRAITADPEVGLLLPCNVVVRSSGGKTIVEAMDPAAAMGIVGNPAVEAVANEAKERLEKALAAL